MEINGRKTDAADPDHNTDKLSQARIVPPAGMDGMDYGQVAIKADAGKEEYATVDIQWKECTWQLTYAYCEHPPSDPLGGK